MEIAIICPYSLQHSGGVQQQVLLEVNYLLSRKSRITLIAPDTAYLPESLQGQPNLTCIDMGRSIRIPGNGSLVPLSFPLFKLANIAARLNTCEVAHFHEPFYPFTYLLARKCHVPMLATFHAARRQNPFYRRLRCILLPVYSRFRLRVAVSPLAQATVADYFPPPELIIPNSVNCEPGQEKLSPNRSHMLLFIGRNEKRKGLATLLDAYARVRKEYPKLELRLIGAGTEAVIAPGVVAMGTVSDRTKQDLLRKARILCAPSLYGESFGVILLEAMAAGTPVIASNIPGYDAVVNHAKNGLLFPPADAESLGGQIQRLLENRQLFARIKRAGTQTARSHDIRVTGEKYFRIFDDLALNKSR
jgi:phosphatidyl-myo-inositol alpha-mannosyltransferase